MPSFVSRLPFPLLATRRGVAIATLSLLIGSAWVTANEAKKQAPVRASDLIKEVQIIGALGRPLGTLVRLRGVWRDLGATKGGNDVEFEISEMDGRRLEEPIHLLVNSFRPFYSEGNLTQVKSTKNWTWNAAIGRESHDKRPPIVGGEEWEMLGVETGSVNGYPAAIWDLIPDDGSEQEGHDHFKYEFATQYKVIRATRLGVKAKSTFRYDW